MDRLHVAVRQHLLVVVLRLGHARPRRDGPLHAGRGLRRVSRVAGPGPSRTSEAVESSVLRGDGRTGVRGMSVPLDDMPPSLRYFSSLPAAARMNPDVGEAAGQGQARTKEGRGRAQRPRQELGMVLHCDKVRVA